MAEAAADRRSLLDVYAVPDCPQERLHAAGFLGEAMDSASLWTTLFNRAGADLLCPFLDSRMLRLALNLAPQVRFRFRRPKDALKRALARLAPAELANAHETRLRPADLRVAGAGRIAAAACRSHRRL